MKIKRYIPAIVAYLLSSAIGLGMLAAKRHAVSAMMETATKSGKPVVVLHMKESKGSSFFFYSLEGDWVGAGEDITEIRPESLMPVRNQGIRFGRYSASRGYSWENLLWRIDLGNLRAWVVGEVNMPDSPKGHEHESSIDYQDVDLSAMMFNESEVICVHRTDDNGKSDLVGCAPTPTDILSRLYSPQFAMPYDVNDFFIALPRFEKSEPEICGYSFAKSEWSTMKLPTDANFLAAGPGGKTVVACQLAGSLAPGAAFFVDRQSSRIVKTLPWTFPAGAGSRWAGGIVHEGYHQAKVVLFDTENGWERHEIRLRSSVFSGDWENADGFAILEPGSR